MGTSKAIVALLIAFGAFFDSAGQLPRFRFIGTPDISYPTEWVYLVDDGIVCLTETPNSRWDKKEVGHYYYSISAKTWNRLERLDSAIAPLVSVVLDNQRLLNDSLVLFSFDIGTDSSQTVCWNFRTDSMYLAIKEKGRSEVKGNIRQPSINVNGDLCCYEQLPGTDSAFQFITFYHDKRASDTILFQLPSNLSRFPKFTICDKGHWISSYSTVLWTEDFQKFDTIRIPGPTSYFSPTFHLAPDGRTLIGTRTAAGYIDIFEIKAQQPLKTMRTWVSDDLIGGPSLLSWQPLGGRSLLINEFHRFDNDGLYRCDSNGMVFLGTTESRLDRVDVIQNTDGSITLASASGLMISRDTARTWTPIPLPGKVQSHFDRSRHPSITMADDGTLIWAGARCMLSYFDRPSGTYRGIPGQHAVADFKKPYLWFRRGDQWLGSHNAGTVFSTKRGVYQNSIFDPWSSNQNEDIPLAYTWLDTCFVKDFNLTCWPPNDTIQQKLDTPESEFFKYVSIKNPFHLKDQVYFIGNSGPEYIDYVDLAIPWWLPRSAIRSVRCRSNSATITYLYRDSLYSWIEADTCAYGIAHPLDKVISSGYLDYYRMFKNPDIVYRVREDRYFGHDSLIIGLIKKDTSSTTPDSVVIMPRDLSTQRVFPLEGIEEPYVYRLLYDKVNRVYYAQTARGVYCSDVATSVDEELSSSAGDPASESAMSVTWYDILGAEVATPISAGMYLKVTRSTNGTQTVEKIILH